MQQALKTASSSRVRPGHGQARPRTLVLPYAVTTTVEAPTAEPTTVTQPTDEGLSDVYIGKGRVIKDDPKKYPGKDNLGPFLGATGGWAGGEAGLWQLREQVQREKAAKKAANAAISGASSSKAKVQPPAPKGDKAPIYVGYGKDDLAQRKAGVPGRFILDDPAKYPAKDDIGFLAGATGGFAGGEKGLKQYIATGEVQLRDPNQPAPKQTSPVAVAGLLAAAGAGGGLLLNNLTDLGEEAVKGNILEAPIDDKTKGLLLVAVGLLATVGALAGGKALVDTLQNRISSAGDQATKLVVAGAFWLAVFVAARTILEL